MAAIPHKTKNGVRYETSGSGFHTPSKYGKNDRRAEKDMIEEELFELSEEENEKFRQGVIDDLIERGMEKESAEALVNFAAAAGTLMGQISTEEDNDDSA